MPNRAGHRRFGNIRKRSPAVSRFAIQGRTAVCVQVLTPMSVRATPSER